MFQVLLMLALVGQTPPERAYLQALAAMGQYRAAAVRGYVRQTPLQAYQQAATTMEQHRAEPSGANSTECCANAANFPCCTYSAKPAVVSS